MAYSLHVMNIIQITDTFNKVHKNIDSVYILFMDIIQITDTFNKVHKNIDSVYILFMDISTHLF